ncbi:MAG: ABC transporter permease [Mycobacterium sp.]
MVSRILLRKLRRDLWRQHWQFLAAAVVIGIGIAVYVAATDAYSNLKQSFDRAYATQLLPDAVISGPGVLELHDAVRALPGDPVVEIRQQGDVGIRINGHTVFGRAVSVPVGRQPAVSQLALRSGELPAQGAVLVEEHLTSHFGLQPGDTIEMLGPTGWRTVAVSGSALSTEYFWPARSQQELMTTPENFGVVFVTAPDTPQLVPEPTDQLLLYARDRSQAPELLTAATQLAQSRGMVLSSRDEQPSYRALQDDVDAVGTFARLLPWVFLVAAVVGTYVLLSRLVAAQRAVIGTLSANGMSEQMIRVHYLTFGVAVGLAGASVGMVGGYFLGGWFTMQYTQALGLPLRVTSLHTGNLIVGGLVGTVAAAVAAWAPARAASRMSPAEAMRISPPGTRGGVSVVERVVPPLRRLPVRWRMTLRGITRSRRRTALTVVGVVISVCLVMVFAGLRDTVSSVINRQYGGIELQDAQVITAAGAADSVAAAARADEQVGAAEPFTRLDVTVEAGNNRYDTLMLGMPRSTEMHRFTSSGSTVGLPADGVLVGQGLRDRLGLAVGDRVTVTNTQNGIRVEQPVVAFVDEPMSPVIYIADEQLSTLSPETGVMLKLVPGASQEAARQAVSAVPGVVAYLSTESIETAIREAFSLYDALVGLMLVFAAVMAAALLYNAMSANVGERTGELGSLQAAGVAARTLGRLVAGENMLLVLIGLPIGLLAGTWLADWFMSTYKTQGYVWHLDMQATTPVIVAVAVLIAAVLAQIPAFRVIGRMDIAKVVRERSL